MLNLKVKCVKVVPTEKPNRVAKINTQFIDIYGSIMESFPCTKGSLYWKKFPWVIKIFFKLKIKNFSLKGSLINVLYVPLKNLYMYCRFSISC